MTFSSFVKNELSSAVNASKCCDKAMCYGMLLFGKSFSFYSISFLAEHKCVIERLAELLFKETGVKADITQTKGKKHKIAISDKKSIGTVMEAFSCSKTDLKKRINMGNLQNLSTEDEIYNCCYRAFLRGAFLACGSVTDPNKNYHLEFVVPYKQLSLDLLMLLGDCGIKAKAANRRGVNIIYIKDSTEIENLLNIMGAPLSELKFIDVKVQKSVVNKINRENNFEIANISRTAAASADQIEIINIIRSKGLFDYLPVDLKSLALAREENPDASLTELAEMFDPPVSRSAVNYKFKKLKDFSKKSIEDFENSVDVTE